MTAGTIVCCPDPLPPSTKWPSVLLRENNISCYWGEVPEQRDGRPTMWLTSGDKHFELRQQEINAESTAQGTEHCMHMAHLNWHIYPDDMCWYGICGPCFFFFYLGFFAWGCPRTLLAHIKPEFADNGAAFWMQMEVAQFLTFKQIYTVQYISDYKLDTMMEK